MRKVIEVICIIIVLFGAGCSDMTTSQVDTEPDGTINDFISERIEMFSSKHFTKMQKCEVSFVEDKGIVHVEFIPDFGSITFKNEIWQWAAAHAINLIYIFPEIKEYHYTVYDRNNNKLMYLFMDEVATKGLPEKYYGHRGPGDYFRYCFTKVELTKIGNELPLDERFFEGSQLP